MRQIKLYVLLRNIIDGCTYENIYAKDGDENFHSINSIDLMYEKISCDDGWYHYFEAFTGDGNCELYYED